MRPYSHVGIDLIGTRDITAAHEILRGIEKVMTPTGLRPFFEADSRL